MNMSYPTPAHGPRSHTSGLCSGRLILSLHLRDAWRGDWCLGFQGAGAAKGGEPAAHAFWKRPGLEL
jgi:hypothetical protein